MYYLDEFCSVCLYNKKNLQFLSDSNNDELSYFNKLTSALLDMNFKEMNNQGPICKECCDNIDKIYAFRNNYLKNKIILLDYLSKINSNNKDIKQEKSEDNLAKKQFNIHLIEVSYSNIKIKNKTLDERIEHSEESQSSDDIKSETDSQNCEIVEWKDSSNDSSEFYDETEKSKKYTDNFFEVDIIDEIQENKYLEKDIVASSSQPSTKNSDVSICPASRLLLSQLKKEMKNLDEKTKKETKPTEKESCVKRHRCHICNKPFFRKDALTRHIKIHTGEKGYVCQICDKKFTEGGNLKVHMRRHTGVRPYSCEYCGKKYREAGTLTEHLRVHTGETPFGCSYCDKSFNRQGTLARHIRTHTGEKRHECQICHKKFTRPNTLTIHLRDIHTNVSHVKEEQK